MGKHKIVKSAAAVALTASVVATAVAPGASAASYKTNSKDQLVYTKSGKLVKGWKVFGGKLYKNGKLAPAKKYKIIGTGSSMKLYYGSTLKKGYKTANSKTLLFKDGKLTDGWKQAGKNERLYKNGKLDKGYTVYTNVEGDKFLYQNGYLKKGLKTANRGGETNLFQDGKLAKGLVEFGGKFYNNGKLANGTIDGKEYENGVLVTDIVSVKAINATTVEVTFKKDQTDADTKTADFVIEGLEVKNAAVKQADRKVVVLTTANQENGKEYTLTHKGESSKKFNGVSAVIPTKVTLTKGSQQAITGNQVTVEATVEVAEGQSKAGIPVTFNIDNNNNFNNDKVVEAVTDENGVAKYSYTQYTKSEDAVYAYASGDVSKRTAVGTVYWGQSQRLTLEEVTEGNTLANGAKKVYKVKSVENANGYINIAFKENVNVTPDKLVRDVVVTDATNDNASTNATAGNYPFQVTTGGVQYTQVKLDKNGEATFTLSGSNASVTPIVFFDGGKYVTNTVNNIPTTSYVGNHVLEETELQAQAPTVTFAAQATQQIDVEALGTANAAAYKGTDKVGGRDYKVTVKGTDGKLAPKGTVVNVAFNTADVPTSNSVKLFGYKADGTLDTTNSKTSAQVLPLTVDANGEVKFRVTGNLNDFAKPTVFIDNGTTTGATALDKKDTQTTAATTYFVNPVVKDASLTVDDLDKKVLANQPATFTYTSLDQNGFEYNNGNFVTTFEVAAKFADVTLSKSVGTGSLTSSDSDASLVVKAGTTRTFTLTSAGEKAAISVVPTTLGQAADVTVKASASQSSLPALTESVSFVKTGLAVPQSVLDAIVAAGKTGTVADVKEALKDVDQYKKLEDAEKDDAAAAIFAEAKDKGAITSNKVLDFIDEAPANVVAANTQAVADDKAVLAATKTITENGEITLPTTGDNGSTITWAKTSESVAGISSAITNGNKITFTRSDADNTDDTVVLTATITKGDATDTQTVTYTVKEAKAPTATLPATTGASSNDGTTLVATFDEALYNGNTAIADNEDVKALFTYDGTAANYVSATYNATNKTVTFLFDGANVITPAPAENGKKLSAVNTLKDANGNVVTDVYTYTATGTIWTK